MAARIVSGLGMVWALLAANCWGQALGAWKMNPAKSRFPSGAAFKAITARYEMQLEAEVWTFDQVRADGSAESISQTLYFDGKEYASGDLGLEGRPDTVVSRKPDARTAEVLYKRSGRVTQRMVRTVSGDGKQMTLEIRITPEKGPVVERKLVFERR